MIWRKTQGSLFLALCSLIGISACGMAPHSAESSSPDGTPTAPKRQIMSTAPSGSNEVEFATFEAQLPEIITEAEASRVLKQIPPGAVDEQSNPPTYDLNAWRLRGHRGSGLSFHRRGFAPRWRGSWANYLYYPVGSYYFPYVYSAGNYWRYRSAYAPYFYFWNNLYTPYYRARWW
ncbi:MAG: hypothetical protein VKN33_00725 [Candidatus Sericytochromatia bacterium]|nr:hypothetical protein [Candidatus Sericytochromatia bacterium]